MGCQEKKWKLWSWSRGRWLLAVLVECLDRDDSPIDEPDADDELVGPPVVGPCFDGSAIHREAVLHQARRAAEHLHGHDGVAFLNELAAATHRVAPRVPGDDETKGGGETSFRFEMIHARTSRGLDECHSVNRRDCLKSR